MEHRNRLAALFRPAVVVALVGCGGGHPPSAGDGPAELVTDQSELAAAGGESVLPAEPGMAAVPPRICEPYSYRECKITYVDEDGQLQCPANIDICSLDGKTWLGCGLYVYDENHEPQPRE